MDQTMQTRINRRRFPENYVSYHHLKLNGLKVKAKAFGLKKYLWEKNIPEYPKPEFQVSLLKHDTTGSGLKGIKKDGGFKAPTGESLIWWSVAVGPEEVKDAELRLLEKTFPDRTQEEAAEQQNFLWRFATSPAFLETSRLGAYRFTFPLQEVLTAYTDQFCSGDEPVMRVYETVLFKQEVMYVVLVHSPEFNGKFSKYPLLKDDPEAVCVYRDGRFIWRPEAMCETHWYELVRNDRNLMEARRLPGYRFYVWDHVAVALHVENTQVLKFDVNKLRENLKYCEKASVKYGEDDLTNLDEAKELVNKLWPEWPGPLEVERSLQLSFPVIELKLVLAGNDGEERRRAGNALVGKDVFTGSGFFSEKVTVEHLVVNIINTANLSELTRDPDERRETLKSIRLSGPELQAFLLVIQLENITEIEETAGHFESVYGEDAWRRTMILLTHQDQTEPDIQMLPQEVKDILAEKVGDRYKVFNSSFDHPDPRLVSDLLNEVKDMMVQL